jgi:chorismate synthase
VHLSPLLLNAVHPAFSVLGCEGGRPLVSSVRHTTSAILEGYIARKILYSTNVVISSHATTGLASRHRQAANHREDQSQNTRLVS